MVIGISIYHSIDVAKRSGLIQELLEGFSAITGGMPFTVAGGVEAASGRAVRERRFGRAAVARLAEEVAGGARERVNFHSQPRSAREANAPDVSLALGLRPHPDGGRFPYEAVALVPRDRIASLETLCEGVCSLASLLDGPYALIHAGTGFTDVFMEVTATPVFPWDHVLTPDEERQRARLLAHQWARAEIGSRLRGAYWGNVLPPAVVERLGGLDAVRRDAPVARVERCGAGVYLQTTADPQDGLGPSYNARRSALEAYLRPVMLEEPESTR